MPWIREDHGLLACRRLAGIHLGLRKESTDSCPDSGKGSDFLQAIGRWWLVWEFGDDTMSDKDACIKAYLRHNDRIKASVAPEQLLVWQAKDGWEPLCR